MDALPSLLDIEQQTPALPKRKAAGPDGLTAELLQVTPGLTAQCISHLYLMSALSLQEAALWRQGALICLAKRAPASFECRLFRSILLERVPAGQDLPPRPAGQAVTSLGGCEGRPAGRTTAGGRCRGDSHGTVQGWAKSTQLHPALVFFVQAMLKPLKGTGVDQPHRMAIKAFQKDISGWVGQQSDRTSAVQPAAEFRGRRIRATLVLQHGTTSESITCSVPPARGQPVDLRPHMSEVVNASGGVQGNSPASSGAPAGRSNLIGHLTTFVGLEVNLLMSMWPRCRGMICSPCLNHKTYLMKKVEDQEPGLLKGCRVRSKMRWRRLTVSLCPREG